MLFRSEDGHQPTVSEALMRLGTLQAGGPSGKAFGWESLRDANLWREKRCA